MTARRSWLLWGGLAAAGLVAYAIFRRRDRYVPGSSEQKTLFQLAAMRAGVPSSWASSPALISVLKNESDGWTGRPNYTYGDRAKDHALWPSVWAELKQGVRSTRSSATGFGQLILENVDKYYPSGRQGIGVPMDEAVGMLKYIKDRYQTPEAALAFGMRSGSWGGY